MNVIYELQPATNEITYLAHLSLLYICIRMSEIYLFIYMIPLTGTRLNLQFHLLHHYFFLGPNNLSNFLLDSISLFVYSSSFFFLYFFSSSSVILLIFSFSFRSSSNLFYLSSSRMFSLLIWKQILRESAQYAWNGTPSLLLIMKSFILSLAFFNASIEIPVSLEASVKLL